jgi:diguanylate cyclase (GGDEF)-like protein|tara:strand:- start:2155 stop:3102 length:948 start_codon:yes stop_codon:yes gene_type:complete
MPSPLQSSNTVDINDSPVVLSQFDNREEDAELDVSLRLIQKLQTTLDLEQVLELFYAELQSAVSFDGLRYTHDEQVIDCEVGRQSKNRCSYRLITTRDYLGEITFCRSRRFQESELSMLENILKIIVYPLRNALNYRDAIRASLTDPLTGAGNRISLINTLRHDIEMARRYDQPMLVLMADMDRFKSINDTYGHGCGDDVLKQLTATMMEDIRRSDSVFRYGGEEFVILLSNTSEEMAVQIAERLRCKIESLDCESQGEKIPTTVSIGIASLRNGDTISKLLDRADQAMYKAKSSGRNQIQVHSTSRYAASAVTI